jgi:guanylate kinase
MSHYMIAAGGDYKVDLTVLGIEEVHQQIQDYIQYVNPTVTPQSIAQLKQFIRNTCQNTLTIQMKLLDDAGHEM